MYEIGEFLGMGGFSMFFRLKKYPRLGVKIRKEGNKSLLEREFAKAQMLRKLGVSVPRYVGIVKVRTPEDIHQIVETAFIRGRIKSWWKRKIPEWLGEVSYGLVMEIIESDLSIITKDEINYFYQKEIQKIKGLGIDVIDSDPGRNVLWSPSKKKFYFIDFDFWEFPSSLLKKVA